MLWIEQPLGQAEPVRRPVAEREDRPRRAGLHTYCRRVVGAARQHERGARLREVAGALIAVPLTALLVILCEHFPSTRWVAALVSNLDKDENKEGQ